MDDPVLRLATVNYPPFTDTVEINGKVTRVGIAWEYEHLFLDLANITRVQLVNVGKGYGEELSAGNWSGGIGAVTRGEVDVFLIHYPATDHLFALTGYLLPTKVEGLTIYGAQGSKVIAGSSSTVAKFLGVEAFVCLFTSWFLASLAYCLFNRRKRKYIFSVSELSQFLFNFYGMFLNQAFTEKTRNVMLRFLLACWLVVSLVVGIAIGAQLSAKLAVVDVPERIESLQDLHKYPQMDAIVFESDPIVDYLNDLKNSGDVHRWKRIRAQLNFLKLKQLMNPSLLVDVAQGRKVVLTNIRLSARFILNIICFIMPSRTYTAENHARILPIVSLYRKNLAKRTVEKLNAGILKMVEYGYYTKLENQFTRRLDPCINAKLRRSLETPLEWIQMKSSFIFLAFGLNVSVIAYVVECMWKMQTVHK